MKLMLQKIHVVLLMFEYKFSGFSGNSKMQQSIREKLVLLHTQMRVEREQHLNKLLFNSL